MTAPVLYIISSCMLLGIIGAAILWYFVRRRRADPRTYIIRWGFCRFRFRSNFGENLAAKMIFRWVLWAGIVEIQCMKNKAERNKFFDDFSRENKS
jgi:glycerol uptake facilitator-like aquaporin